MNDHAPALEVRNLRKTYSGTVALDRLTLAFPSSRISAVIGTNGAGKSTLVKILAGATRPSGGEILLGGRRVELRSPGEALHQGIATVHQERSLIPGLTVGENILIGRFPRRRGLLRAAIDGPALYSRANQILHTLRVTLDVHRRVALLSPAEQQMVEIARAMSFDAQVVLLDEPTAGLARTEVDSLFALMRTLSARGVAILYVTHRMSELGEIADRVTVLRDGRHAGTMPAKEAGAETIAEAMFGVSATLGADGAPDAVARPSDRIASDGKIDRSPHPNGGFTRPPLLEVRGLALKDRLFDVDLTLGRGEILGIAGMLGSGRTELLMCLFGAIRADRGRIRVFPEPSPAAGDTGEPRMLAASSATPTRMKRLGIALIPEDRKAHGLVLGMSALDNACLASLRRVGRAGVVTRGRQRRAMRPLFQALAIAAPDVAEPVSALSGGNQQKVVIAKWLNTRPTVLLFDEPTQGIDIGAKQQMFEIIRKLSQEGLGAILVSSDLEELPAICDRILILRRGRIVDEMTPDAATVEQLLVRCM